MDKVIGRNHRRQLSWRARGVAAVASILLCTACSSAAGTGSTQTSQATSPAGPSASQSQQQSTGQASTPSASAQSGAASAQSGASSSGPSASGAGSSSASPQTISQDRCQANKAAGTIKYASPFGFDASAGILDVFAAQKLGYFTDLCLNVEFVTHATNSSSLVSSNTAQVTNVGSAADLMNGISHGADLVGIATYGNVSNYAILTRPDITKLSDLKGKNVAYHGVLPIVLRQMIQASGLSMDDISLVLSNSYDPNQLFETDLGGLQAYRTNEPLVLSQGGRKFNEFTPDQFGVQGTFNIQTVNGTFLKAHPDAVQDFLRAELRAYYYCAEHQSECVDILAGYAKDSGTAFKSDLAKQEWALVVKLVSESTPAGKGVGYQSPEAWQNEADATQKVNNVHLPEMSTYQNTALVAGIYDGASLIWP